MDLCFCVCCWHMNCVYVGAVMLQTEAPLMVKPLLGSMTRSEIHAVMTGGFATVAGGVLAAFISMGVQANHLISASVMSAPAALAMSKLFYPETKKSKTTAKDVGKLPRRYFVSSRNLYRAIKFWCIYEK